MDDLRAKIAMSVLVDIRRAVASIAHIAEENPALRDQWVNDHSAIVAVAQADALLARLAHQPDDRNG